MNIDEDVTILIDQIKVANSLNNTKSDECTGLENGTYQKCGTKCVLGCRHTPLSSDIAVTSTDCEKIECIEGCFCNVGFVRYQDKCILPIECPVRDNKSIELATKMPNTSDKRIIIKPNKPCLPFLCNTGKSCSFWCIHIEQCFFFAKGSSNLVFLVHCFLNLFRSSWFRRRQFE